MIYRKILILIILFTGLLFPQKIFIKYKSSVSIADVQSKVSSKSIFKNDVRLTSKANFNAYLLNRNVVSDDVIDRIVVIKIDDKSLYEAAYNNLNNDNDIEYVEKGHTYKIDYTPNDSLVSRQWGLGKIDAFRAWDITRGADSVVIGLIDTGIDYLHPDIKNKIYLNKGEIGIDSQGRDKSTNGIDDDGNGFVDDYMGFDFVNRVGFPFDTTGGRDYLGWDNNPMDQHFHGTFTGGIIAAESNNIIGISGAAPNIKILNIRCFDPDGYGEEDDVAAGVLYAVKMKVKVLNMSFGDDSFSYVLRDVIRYAYQKGLVLVASSGNSGSPLPHYPSGYSEVISVGNSTEEDYVASNSNYGSTLDLVAPGTNIISLNKGGGYRTENGTSASAPFVSAAAGLILSLKNFSNEEVKQILKSTCDDIGSGGWDERSGAGRLNIYKALSILAPAKVKFNSPTQDLAESKDTIKVSVTVISPYFISYNLYLGEGLNPKVWQDLLIDQKYQVQNEIIYKLVPSNLKDTSYTLRLVLKQSNGFSSEERVNFHIMKTAPEITLVGGGPLYYGNISTLAGEVYSSQRSISKMYYRKKGTTEFSFISLDGFNTNNLFVKQLHYGFVPKNLVTPNTTYEVYFEAENLAGLSSILMDNNNKYFEFSTENSPEPIPYTVLPYSLPQGTLYKDVVSLSDYDSTEVIFNTYYPSQNLYYSLFKKQNNVFVRNTMDSLQNRIPISVNDFYKTGLKTLVSNYVRTGYLDVQKSSSLFSFTNIKKDTSGKFYSVLVADPYKNGNPKIFTNYNDEKYFVYKLNSDLSTTFLDTLKNYSFLSADALNSEEPNAIKNNVCIADINGDGIKEFWFTDQDGDVLSYNINGDTFSKGDSLITSFVGLRSNAISAGDYDGDGVEDLAVLFSSNDIAPKYFLLIFNYKNHQLNILTQKMFLDQSAEFSGFGFANKVYQSLRMVDVDNDGRSELVLNIFPYAYIFKYNSTQDKIIFYKEGVNTESIFAGDLNKNNVKEVALQDASGYKFYEFGQSNIAIPPNTLNGYAVKLNSVHLDWQGKGSKYYIYRGTSSGNLALIDSTSSQLYLDNSISGLTNIYYAIKAYDASYANPISQQSDMITVVNHQPAKIISGESKVNNTILIKFDSKIRTKIDNLESFYLDGIGFPNSVSPESEYSYLLSFRSLPQSGTRKIFVKSLRDLYNSPIQDDSLNIQFNINQSTQEFFISSAEIVTPFKILLKFNLPYDTASALNLSNYSFQPNNTIESIEKQANDPSALYLNLKKEKPIGSIGKEYVLKISNVYSNSGGNKIKINDETGSYVVLVGYQQDLSTVYTYPNPARISNGSGTVTFANLPKKAKILIMSLQGEQLAEIVENDGNGGVIYDLKDKRGNLLSTGVYIYRIVRLDDSNIEIEDKIGKFAVIK